MWFEEKEIESDFVYSPLLRFLSFLMVSVTGSSCSFQESGEIEETDEEDEDNEEEDNEEEEEEEEEDDEEEEEESDTFPLLRLKPHPRSQVQFPSQ